MRECGIHIVDGMRGNSSISDICTCISFIWIENYNILRTHTSITRNIGARIGNGHNANAKHLAEDIIKGEVGLLGFAGQSVRPR